MIESSCLIPNLSTYCSKGGVTGAALEIAPDYELSRILAVEEDPLALKEGESDDHQ